MKKNEIYFIGYDAIGDYLSYNGLIRNLFENYNKITIVCQKKHHSYIRFLFNDLENLFCVEEPEFNNLCQNNLKFDVIDLRVWQVYDKQGNYDGICYNRNHKFGQIKNNLINDNSSFFYNHLGFDVNDKINNFYFKRDFEKEDELFQRLSLNDKKYNVICEYSDCEINHGYIQNNDIMKINLHNLSPDFLDIIKIIENAQEVHLVENSISLLVYYLQNKFLMKDVKVTIHASSRKEPHRRAYKEYFDELMNNQTDLVDLNTRDRDASGEKNFYLNMFLYPKLKNWEFVW